MFKNSGELNVLARLAGEIYFEDVLAEIIQSGEMLALKNEEIQITAYFEPEHAGKYMMHAKAVYAGKETEYMDAGFSIFKNKKLLDGSNKITGFASKNVITGLDFGQVIMILSLITAAVAVVIYVRDRKKK